MTRRIQLGFGLARSFNGLLVLGSDGLALIVDPVQLDLKVNALGSELAHPHAILLDLALELLGCLLQLLDFGVLRPELLVCGLVKHFAHLGKITRHHIEETGAFLSIGLQGFQKVEGIV